MKVFLSSKVGTWAVIFLLTLGFFFDGLNLLGGNKAADYEMDSVNPNNEEALYFSNGIMVGSKMPSPGDNASDDEVIEVSAHGNKVQDGPDARRSMSNTSKHVKHAMRELHIVSSL